MQKNNNFTYKQRKGGLKMNSIKIFLISSFMIITVLFFSPMTVSASQLTCGNIIHVMTQKYYQTLVRNYEHAYQYGTCHVKVEEIQKVTRCQCNSNMTIETISITETHSMQH